VLSIFSGLRPAGKVRQRGQHRHALRDHTILVSASGLVTITGGKWTTYAKWRRTSSTKPSLVAGLEKRACRTQELRIHGWMEPTTGLAANLHPTAPMPHRSRICFKRNRRSANDCTRALPYQQAEVIWHSRHEMARTVRGCARAPHPRAAPRANASIAAATGRRPLARGGTQTRPPRGKKEQIVATLHSPAVTCSAIRRAGGEVYS